MVCHAYFLNIRAWYSLDSFAGFLDKVKSGKAQAAGSGFGGKGLDRLDKEREARDKAERKAYGEDEKEEKPEAAPDGAAPAAANGTTTTAANGGGDMLSNFKVEVRRGPAPDSSKGSLGVTGAALAARKLALAKEEEKLQKSIKEAEEAAARAGKDTPAHKQAMTVIAKLNAQLRAQKFVLQSQIQAAENAPARPQVTGDVSEYHAIIPINDYPQKARWRVTNKETMVNLIEITGASVTNKGAP
jgi:ATP-dependent RNA helicase DDX46/PRP5